MEQQKEQKKIRIRFKKCVDCALINTASEEIKPCQNDPSCPAGNIIIDIGVDPEIMVKEIANKFTAVIVDPNNIDELLQYFSENLDKKFFRKEWITEALSSIVNEELLDSLTSQNSDNEVESQEEETEETQEDSTEESNNEDEEEFDEDDIIQ